MGINFMMASRVLALVILVEVQCGSTEAPLNSA